MLRSVILEDSVPIIYQTDVPVLFSLTVDGALSKKWKPWKMKYLELRSDGTMIYRQGKAPSPIQGKLDMKDVIISEVTMQLDTTNPLIEKEIGINVQCLKDNIKTYFRCVITQSAFDQLHLALQSIGQVKFEKAAANLSIRQSQSKNQSTFRKAVTKEWDRARNKDRYELVVARRGAYKWLPVLCENDLVHGSWWFVVGSLLIVISGAVVLANNFNSSILGEEDDGTGEHLDDFTFDASWSLVILMGFFYTLGSLAFVRATHFDPPMKPLFTSYHISTDELLASWLFLFGTIPGVPYVLLFFKHATHVLTRMILLFAFFLSLFFVYAVLLFVLACYPNQGISQDGDSERPHRVLNMTLSICRCCFSEKFLRKHLANDWLAACWLFLWSSIIATLGTTYLFLLAIAENRTNAMFIMGTCLLDCLIFTIGSAYFVAGSYPEVTEGSDMLTETLTRIDEQM